MNGSVAQKGLLGLAVLLALFYIVVGVSIQAEGDFGSVGEKIAWGLAAISAGAFILAGLWLSKRAPLLGGILVVVGAVPLGLFMWWLFFIPPVVALVVAVFGVVRARRFAREPGRIAPA